MSRRRKMLFSIILLNWLSVKYSEYSGQNDLKK